MKIFNKTWAGSFCCTQNRRIYYFKVIYATPRKNLDGLSKSINQSICD